jgi:electron transport complex protein RnfB
MKTDNQKKGVSMSEDEIYHKFVTWLGKAWYRLPDSTYLMPLIQKRYSLSEAAFLTGIPHSAVSLEEIAKIKEMPIKVLAPLVQQMCRQGLMYKIRRRESVRYRLNDAFFVFFRSSYWSETIEGARESASLVNKYYYDGFYDQYATVHAKGLRALPIDQTIPDHRKILPYEDVLKVLDNVEYYTVSDCPCRQRKKMDPDSQDCAKPMGVCLHFDELGHYIVDQGMGREISREETKQILKTSADAGLVHGISNWKEKPDTICNCCSCCCLWTEAFHKLGHHKGLDASNYLVTIQPATCKACGLCVKRCPMDALQLTHSAVSSNKYRKAAKLITDDCIGCGVCVHKCPTQSLKLVQKDELVDPPQNVREYGMRFMQDARKGVPLLRKSRTKTL